MLLVLVDPKWYPYQVPLCIALHPPVVRAALTESLFSLLCLKNTAPV
jgi:hypothetical protein